MVISQAHENSGLQARFFRKPPSVSLVVYPSPNHRIAAASAFSFIAMRTVASLVTAASGAGEIQRPESSRSILGEAVILTIPSAPPDGAAQRYQTTQFDAPAASTFVGRGLPFVVVAVERP